MAYSKTTWQNEPNQTSPLNATNLNKIEQGIYANDEAITNLYDEKVISESGSNANGRYVKWADGTMEVWGRGTLTDIRLATAFGTFFRNVSGDASIALPAPFVDTNFESFVQLGNSSVTPFTENVLGILQTISYTTTSIRFYILSGASQTATIPYRYHAIGRWKA